MKKIPKVYQNTIDKKLNNNNKVYYEGKKEEIRVSPLDLDDFFKQNKVYRTECKIYLKDNKVLEKRIIGRSINHLITNNNELIEIKDILNIELK